MAHPKIKLFFYEKINFNAFSKDAIQGKKGALDNIKIQFTRAAHGGYVRGKMRGG